MFGWFKKKKKSFETVHCVAYMDHSGEIVIKCFYEMFDAIEYCGNLLDLIEEGIEVHVYPATLV